MPFIEDATTQNVYLDDFGVSCTSGGTTAKGILEQPDQILAQTFFKHFIFIKKKGLLHPL